MTPRRFYSSLISLVLLGVGTATAPAVTDDTDDGVPVAATKPSASQPTSRPTSQPAATRPALSRRPVSAVPLPAGSFDDAVAFLDNGRRVIRTTITATGENGIAVVESTDAPGEPPHRAALEERVSGFASGGTGLALLLGGGTNGAVRGPGALNLTLWDLAGPTRQFTLEPKGKARHGGPPGRVMAAAGNGKRILSAHADPALCLWDATTGEFVRDLTPRHYVNRIALSGNGKLAALAGSGTEYVDVIDAETGQRRFILDGHHGPITQIAFSPDDKFILSASLDGTTRLWSAADGRELRRLRPRGVGVRKAVFSPDGRRVVTALVGDVTYVGGNDNPLPRPQLGKQLRVWDLAEGKLIGGLESDEPVVDIAFSPDGRRVLGVTGAELLAWDAPQPDVGPATDLSTPHIDAPPSAQVARLGNEAATAAGFLASGDVYSAGRDNTVVVWAVPGNVKKAAFAPAESLGEAEVRAVSPDGRFAVSMEPRGGGAAFLWATNSGKTIARLDGQGASFVSAVFSPDSTLVALGRSDANAGPGGAAAFFRTQDGKPVGSLNAYHGRVTGIAFTPDGNRLAFPGPTAGQAVTEYDLDTASRKAWYDSGVKARLPLGVAYSADGLRVLAWNTAGLNVWDVAGRRRQSGLTFGEPITVACISPDGKQVITGGVDTNLRVYNADTVAPLATFDDPTRPPRWLAVSPDGKWLLSAGEEAGVRVFRLP